jgi:outer membrane protein, heavy metal efflux system
MTLALLLGRSTLLALALLAGAPSHAQVAQWPTSPPTAGDAALGSTLDGLLARARDIHPELRAMQYEADAAAQRIGPAGALPDPMFQVELRDVTNEMRGGSFNLLPGRVGSTRYQLRQTFPAWGRRDAKRDAAQAGADEAALRTDATWAELATRIKTAYARWQQVHDTLQQSREILALIDRLESVAQARYAGGVAPQQDAIRAQVERTTMASEILLLESELAATRVRINGLLARPASAPLAAPLADADLPALARLDADALRDRVLLRNPQLAAEDARLRAAERNKDVVWSNRYPEFTFGVSPVQSRNRISEWELMFEISIPLQQGSRRAEEREAQSMIAAAQARKEAAANELLAQLGEQLEALRAAHRIESLTRLSLLPQADVTLQAALAGYESGKVDFATVLEAQRQIRQARLTLIRTRADARMRLAEIEQLLGETL